MSSEATAAAALAHVPAFFLVRKWKAGRENNKCGSYPKVKQGKKKTKRRDHRTRKVNKSSIYGCWTRKHEVIWKFSASKINSPKGFVRLFLRATDIYIFRTPTPPVRLIHPDKITSENTRTDDRLRVDLAILSRKLPTISSSASTYIVLLTLERLERFLYRVLGLEKNCVLMVGLAIQYFRSKFNVQRATDWSTCQCCAAGFLDGRVCVPIIYRTCKIKNINSKTKIKHDNRNNIKPLAMAMQAIP